MDHGLAAPFDLDSLRSKVEGRFDSVERLSKGLFSILFSGGHHSQFVYLFHILWLIACNQNDA